MLSNANDFESNDPELVEGPHEETAWFMYIAATNKDSYYVGISPDPNHRIEKHNKGLGAKFARDRGGLRLVYVSKPFKSKSEARIREIQVKGWTRAKKLKLINGEWD